MDTAIETKSSSAYANVFMSRLEKNMLREAVLKPWVWWRFLDDTFLIWLHGKHALMEFLEYV